jgi:hypothetical protein
MILTRNVLLPIAFAAVIGLGASLDATPGFARKIDGTVFDGTVRVSAARAAALRECNARSRPYIQRDWGVTELQIYRACMAEHNQPE